ncbi:MAG: hypothetical protein ACT4PP_16265 [Sporichthyaceae bacterium]
MGTPRGELALAHGLAGGREVPISLTLAMAGAGLAVLLSFVIMAALWRTSVLRGAAAGRPLPSVVARFADAPGTRWTLKALGLAMTGLFVAAAAYGPPDTLVNPSAGIVYIFFWVGLIPASLLFGPVWRLLNPLRTLHQLIAVIAGQPADRGLRALPERVGYWPAALGLLAFTWLELVAPAGEEPRVLLQFFGFYAIAHLIAASIYGAAWFERADAFEAYSNLTAKLSPLGRRDDGALVLRNPFDGLDSVRPAPGLVALVCVWLGSTAYDGFTRSGAWRTIVTEGLEAGVVPYDADGIKTIAFVLIIALAAGLYIGATASAARFGGGRAARMPGQFAHSLVPIAIGYTLAHYFSLALFAGQRTLALASDPLDKGANLFGTANYQPDYAALSDGQIAVIQVAAVITGHVLGAVAAHDRAARLFSHKAALTGQLPLLALMLAYTTGGLSLLFAN